MKKPSFSRICLLLLCVLLLITGICLFRSQNRYRAALHRIGADALRSCTIQAEDTHGGFHHDGTAIYCYSDLRESEIAELLQKNPAWKRYTQKEPINRLLYGGGQDVYYDALVAFEPVLTDGFYWFLNLKNQNAGATESDITALYEQPSRNFILALLDTEKRALYDIQYDS